MRLQKYNEITFAILSTVALLGALAGIATFLLSTITNREPRGVVVNHPNKPMSKQALLFCLPTSIAGSNYEYYPVGAVVQRNAGENPILAASQSSKLGYDRFTGCQLGSFSRTFNIVIRNTNSGEERLLSEQPGQVESLKGPSEKCKGGEGDMPCKYLLWVLRSVDTNKDGTINQDDASTAYISNLDGTELRPVTPPAATVVSSSWLPKSNRLVFQLRFDTNKDGKFTEEDGSSILDTDASNPAQVQNAFHDPIMKRLQNTVQ